MRQTTQVYQFSQAGKHSQSKHGQQAQTITKDRTTSSAATYKIAHGHVQTHARIRAYAAYMHADYTHAYEHPSKPSLSRSFTTSTGTTEVRLSRSALTSSAQERAGVHMRTAKQRTYCRRRLTLAARHIGRPRHESMRCRELSSGRCEMLNNLDEHTGGQM